MDLEQAITYLYGSLSAQGGCRGDVETWLMQTNTFMDGRCFNIQISPLPCRRTSSAISEFLPLTPFKSRSARQSPASSPTPGHVMPRHSNISVARFCDWSDQEREREECLSVSRLYQEIAVGAGLAVPRSLSEKVRPRGGAKAGGGQWAGNGPARSLNPGRMFLRDKGMLTKGEREIIQGICRNRGDIKRDPGPTSKSDFWVRSHQDAWLVGKSGAPANKPSTELPRDPPARPGGLMEVTVPAPHPGANSSRPPGLDLSGTRSEGAVPAGRPAPACVICMKEQQLLQQLQSKQAPHSLSQGQGHQGQGHQGQGHQGQGHHYQQQQQLQLSPGRSRKSHHHHHHQQPHPALPAHSVLRPVNVNDTFRPRGEAPTAAPPTTPDGSGSPAVATAQDSMPSFLFATSGQLSQANSPSLPSSGLPVPKNTPRWQEAATASTVASTTTVGGGATHQPPPPPPPSAAQQPPQLSSSSSPSSPPQPAPRTQPLTALRLTPREVGGGEVGAASDGEGDGSQDSDGSRKKVHVYLPTVPDEPQDDDSVSTRPGLARERPLSSSDLSRERREEGRGEELVEEEEEEEEEWVGGEGRGVKSSADSHRDPQGRKEPAAGLQAGDFVAVAEADGGEKGSMWQNPATMGEGPHAPPPPPPHGIAHHHHHHRAERDGLAEPEPRARREARERPRSEMVPGQWHHNSRKKGGKVCSKHEAAGSLPAAEWDGDSARAVRDRCPLIAQPVTILRAERDDYRTQDE